MFKNLKKRIQEESGASPDNSFNHGPGLASPVSKESPGFPGPKKDSPRKDRERRDSVDSSASADETTRTKEEVLAMLLKRTEQVKRLEGKISELAAMIKERNKNIEKLENTLEKTEDDSVQKLEGLREQLTKAHTVAFREKEEELRNFYSKLEKANGCLKDQLNEAKDYKNKYLRQTQEGEEQQGLNSQELEKLQQMLASTQEDVRQKEKDLDAKCRLLECSEKKVKQLENEIMQFTQKLLDQQTVSEKLGSLLNDERKKNEGASQENLSLKSRLESTDQQLTQVSQRLNNLNTSYQEIQDDHMILQRSSDVHRQKMNSLLEEKDEQISQIQERVETLNQRLQDTSLSGDERSQAMEMERALMEKRMEESRQQLSEVKTTWSDKITLLEKQISNLNKKISEDAEDLSLKEKELYDCQQSLQAKISEATQPLENKIQVLESNLSTVQSDLKNTESSLARKEKLLLEQKQSMEVEIVKCKQKCADVELELRDSVGDYAAKVSSLEKAREKDRLAAQQRIAHLENSHEEWLEKEIDTEKQVTELEEQLQKYRAESSHRERDKARLQQQLRDRSEEIQSLKEKVLTLERGLEASQATVEQMKKDVQTIGADFQKVNKEKDELMLRNATLFQAGEAEKRSHLEEMEGYVHDVKSKDVAIAGLEQSLQDMSSDLSFKQKRISELETEQETALKEYESAQVEQLRKEVIQAEEILNDRNKTIKIQQQRLVDLKKTLQRELKVQALPNDDPVVDYNNREAAPQLEVLTATTSSVSSRPYNFMLQASQGNGNMHRKGIKVPAGAERTMTMMTRCSAGNDCLCEHVNFEYLKHVIIKFMTSREHEALHLIRAIAVLLHLSQDEQRVIKDTLEWKMSWGFASRPKVGKGQMAKVIPPSY